MGTLVFVVGFGVLAYGVAMGMLYPAAGFFLVWVALGMAMGAVGLALREGVWAGLPAWVHGAVYACAFAFVAVVVVGCGLIASASTAAAPRGLDYLVVLGASLNADGSPKETLRFRLDAAADYLEENPDSRVVVSGGQGPDEPQTEASAMATYLEAHGVAADRILLEDRSTSTAENLRYARDVMHSAGAADDTSVGIVTNDFHVFRAVRIARRQGLSGVHGLAAPTNALYLPQAVLRECFVIAKDALVGNL